MAVRGQAAYCVATHSLIGLTRVAALECAQPKIAGIIETLMLQRFSGDAAEGRRGMRNSRNCALARFGCSRLRHVGHTTVADGGQTVGI